MLTEEERLAKQEARRLVQEKLAQARALMREAETIMDEHRFSVSFNIGNESWHDVEYLPKGMTDTEAGRIYDGDGQLFWHGVDETSRQFTEKSGYWASSSEVGDC